LNLLLELDAYIRVSKVAGRTGDSFISPGVQRERIESWAQAKPGGCKTRDDLG
jgi:hypothetical protein